MPRPWLAAAPGLSELGCVLLVDSVGGCVSVHRQLYRMNLEPPTCLPPALCSSLPGEYVRCACQGKTFLVTRTRFLTFAWGGMGNGLPICVQLNGFFFFKSCLAAPSRSGGKGELVPGPGIEPGPLALGVWRLSHWTTRKVPKCDHLYCSAGLH